MHYTDLNTGVEIGASCHHIEMGGMRIMLDCGVHPKKVGTDSLPDFSKVGDDTLDLIAISHAHLDHSGALPYYALRQRFADILASFTTCDLTLRMLRNSRNVMMRQREEMGIKEYPLFEFSQIDALKSRMLQMPYGHVRNFENQNGKVDVEFFRSGHIPGASSISVVTDKESLLYTGDISFHASQVIKGAEIPPRHYDVLIMETTRGISARSKDSGYEQECARFVEDVSRVLSDGGSVLVPCFALGRMQEILQLVRNGMREKLIPADTPVYAAGLGIDVSEYMVKEARKDSGINFDKTACDLIRPFKDKIVPALDFEQKGIYVFGSGMMVENTPSYFAASALMEHPKNAIFFVGYCDPDTPGGRLLKKAKGDTTFVFQNLGYIARTNCRIDHYDLSSHADRRELLDFALRVDPRVIILTHGDEEARNWFMDEILDVAPHIGIEIARPGETLKI